MHIGGLTAGVISSQMAFSCKYVSMLSARLGTPVSKNTTRSTMTLTDIIIWIHLRTFLSVVVSTVNTLQWLYELFIETQTSLVVSDILSDNSDECTVLICNTVNYKSYST